MYYVPVPWKNCLENCTRTYTRAKAALPQSHVKYLLEQMISISLIRKTKRVLSKCIHKFLGTLPQSLQSKPQNINRENQKNGGTLIHLWESSFVFINKNPLERQQIFKSMRSENLVPFFEGEKCTSRLCLSKVQGRGVLSTIVQQARFHLFLARDMERKHFF